MLRMFDTTVPTAKHQSILNAQPSFGPNIVVPPSPISFQSRRPHCRAYHWLKKICLHWLLPGTIWKLYVYHFYQNQVQPKVLKVFVNRSIATMRTFHLLSSTQFLFWCELGSQRDTSTSYLRSIHDLDTYNSGWMFIFCRSSHYNRY